MAQEDVLKVIRKKMLVSRKEIEKEVKLSKRAVQWALSSLVRQGEILAIQIKNRRFYVPADIDKNKI